MFEFALYPHLSIGLEAFQRAARCVHYSGLSPEKAINPDYN